MPRATTPRQPSTTYAVKDNIRRHVFDEDLRNAAKLYLMQVFVGTLRPEGPNDTIAAAMHIVSNTSWVQPTEAQIRYNAES